MEYKDLLKRARESLPQTKKSDERFEIPRVISTQAGRQTIIKNFNDIAKKMRREPKHLMKFLFKSLAVPGSMKDNELWLQGKVSEFMLNQRIEDYAKAYVLCQSCGKPDTSLQKSERFLLLKCEACGARRSIGKE